jgi:hypothetical protein
MATSKELKFIRFRSIPDDIVGYVTYRDDLIIIETPLRVDIETHFEEHRQMLLMNEYLPQSIIDIQEVEFFVEDILLIASVKPEFAEHYEFVADFFYTKKHKIKTPHTTKKKSKSKKVEEPSSENERNVISILDALASKKDKPVH